MSPIKIQPRKYLEGSVTDGILYFLRLIMGESEWQPERALSEQERFQPQAQPQLV